MNHQRAESGSLVQLNENSIELMDNTVPDYADNQEANSFVITKPLTKITETYASTFTKSMNNLASANSPNSTKRTIQSRSRSRGTKSKSPHRKNYVNDPEWHHDKKYEDFLNGVYLKHPKNFLSSH